MGLFKNAKPLYPSCREALRQLVNYLEQDPDLYEGDDDGTLGRLIYAAKQALEARRNKE